MLLGEVPSGKMQDWSADQVSQWLTHLQCDREVIEDFRRHKINGFALTKLEEKHLEKMQHVMIGDQVTIISKRNEVLEKEALEASDSIDVFQNTAEETNKAQERTANLEFAKVNNNQNDMDQLPSFPLETEETKLNISIILPISADIAEASYQTQTSLHETEEMKQNHKDVEEDNSSNLLTYGSDMFLIPEVGSAAEVVLGNGDYVDNMPSKGIQNSDSKENFIVSESVTSDQFQNSCEERSLGLQEHVSESNIPLILDSSSSIPLSSVNNDFVMEKSVTKPFLDKHLHTESLASKLMPEISVSEKLTPNSSGEHGLSNIGVGQALLCKEHGPLKISDFNSKACAEAKSEQSTQQASRSGNEFTSTDSLGSNEKVLQCEHLTSLFKGVQMASEKVIDKQVTETNNEITDIMESKIPDIKQINAQTGMSDYKALTEISKVDGNINMIEDQNLCSSGSGERNVYDEKAMCKLDGTLSDSDKMSKNDEKLLECDQKQVLESRVEIVSVECSGSPLVSTGDILKPPSRRFKNAKELLEFKKQQQSARSHSNRSPSSRPFPEEECLISQISDKSKESVSSFQMTLTKDKGSLPQLTKSSENPGLGQGTLNTKDTEPNTKDLSLGIKVQNCPYLTEKKELVSEVHVNSIVAKVEATVETEKITEQFQMDSKKSVEALYSKKLESQFVEPHCYSSETVQSTDSVQHSTTAETSTLTQKQMRDKFGPVQGSSSTAKKGPSFSQDKSPKKFSTSSSKTPVTSQPNPISAAVIDQKKSSVKLIGKNAPQNESKAKFLRKTLALTEHNIIKADQLPAEVLRKIGSQTDLRFRYKQGSKISACETSSGRSLLYPVHRFALFESLKDVTSLSEFCKEVIQFACACLNDRINGIIHFGIESGSRNSIAVYGKIVGVALHRETKEYGDFLRKAIQKCFNEAQAEAALQCIKGPEFIETVPNDIPALVPRHPKLFVIEVDVIPEYKFCKEEIFCVRLPTKQRGCFEPESIFRIIDGAPCKLDACDQFRMKVPLLAAERRELEDQSRKKQKIENDLSKKFIHLFCHGAENLLGDHYHILVVNRPDGLMDRECMKTTLSFIAEIESKVVFDFDAEASLCNFVQEQEKPIKLKMTDDFYHRSKYNIQEPDRLKQMLDDLKNSDCPTWIFANGYQPQNEELQSPREWKKNRAEGFKCAVRFFRDQIPQGRATVLFLLLSKETEVMLLAADELMTIFYKQWMCVAENEDIGKPWIDELVRRDSTEPENAESNVVWGMPWKHVQQTVTHLLGPKKYSICELPTSTGAYIPVNNTMNNELTDLEILGSFECDNAEIQYDEELLRQHKKKVEEDFYKGNCVSWWNFWSHQVCVRDILESAKRNVHRALINEDDTVGKVFLHHQPGAGATTLVKNILWDFKKEYRCAVVRKISGGQTAGQVLKLFWYEDNNPKPVLLLLDNPDADKLNLLYADLSEMTRCIIKSSDDVPRVVCVLLVCSRQSQLRNTVDSDPHRLLLKHELSRRELNWFQDRYKYLSAEFANVNSDFRPPNAVNPRLLISFNVMKENFNAEYIRRTVKELVQAITDAKEKQLLKYVSLLNSFDLECRPVPTSSLDGMMLEIPWSNQGGLRFGAKAKSNRWETKLSPEVRVLLNETSETALGKIHSLRIASPLLSKEILYVLRNYGSVPVGDISLEFFRNKEIFNSLCLPRDNLVNIIKDVLKRRQQKGGKPETAFSPLIQHIVDHESIDTAVDVMKEVLALTSDPYIDQQLARLYIKAQNWEMATEFAKKATDQRPENSFFWDTYGRIYERQLVEEYEKLAKDTVEHSVGDLVHVIRIALDGMRMFRKVQETSEQEKSTIFGNKAGFFGELQMVVCLLDCLTYVFTDKDELRAFILTELVPSGCKMLEDVDGRNYLEELKTLEKHVQQAMNRLEDELVQLRDDTLYEYQRTKYSKYEIDSLQRLKENLDSYFGEEGDNPPENLNEKDQCEFRRRRVFRLASHNIGSIFDLRWKDIEGEENLIRIRRIALQNLKTQHANAEDYLVAICVTLALTSMNVSSLYDVGIKFDDMVEWSTRLYTLRETSIVIHLEPYLFYVMFNWPRKNTKHSVVPKRLADALRQWKDAYYAKYPRQKDEGKPYRKKDTTMFFLANGSEMNSIYTTYDERGSRRINENRGRDSFWKMPDTLRKLQRFDGVLSRDGNEVSVHLHYTQGNKAPITIPTSLPIQNRNMWNKKVYFVIGFSWNGPRAFDVSLTDPTLQADMARDHTLSRNITYNLTYAPSRRPIPDFTQEDFCRKFSKIIAQLEKIHRIEDKSNSGYIPKPDEVNILSI